jgi:hypothetical protein
MVGVANFNLFIPLTT